jgi:hypothetical protein
VRSILACWERGDLKPEQWSPWASPEIEFVTVGGPEPSRHTNSGVEIEQLRATVFHVGAGKVTRRVNYWDRALALAARGLEE